MSDEPQPFALSSVMPVRANDGAAMPIRHSETFQVMHNRDGSVASITIRGRTSRAFRQAVIDINRQRVERKLTEEALKSPEHAYETDTSLLIACTAGWNFDELTPGVPFPYSPENARQFWEDDRFEYLRDQATGFMLSNGNFLPLPEPLSSDTPDISSGSTSLSQDHREAA